MDDECDNPNLWNPFPKDDAWKRCSLRGVVDAGQRLWLDCCGCNRHRYIPVLEWAEKHGVDLDTPLLLVARRVRCSRCGRRAVKVRSEPYSNLQRHDMAATRSSIDGHVSCPICGSINVEKSPIRRPMNGLRPEGRFMPYKIMIECECGECGNWWTQPRNFSFAAETSRTDRDSPEKISADTPDQASDAAGTGALGEQNCELVPRLNPDVRFIHSSN
jgi:hypothetical protein